MNIMNMNPSQFIFNKLTITTVTDPDPLKQLEFSFHFYLGETPESLLKQEATTQPGRERKRLRINMFIKG